MSMNENLEIFERINKFNEQNKKKPHHRTFCHINSLEEYPAMAQNGAVCALHFSQCVYGKTFSDKLEFASFDKLLNYLRQHT